MGRLVPHPSTPGRQGNSGVRAAQSGLMARQASSAGELPRGSLKKQSSFAMLPHESEDTQMTGGTRSLVRRLTALNLPGSLRKATPEIATVRRSKIA